MPRQDLRHCRVCKRHVSECGELSHTRKCEDCAMQILHENIAGLMEHKGEALRRWRSGVIRSAGGIEPDDVRQAV